MKTYICSKIIKAKPMNRKEYCDYRGWEMPEDENGDDEGYLVEYAGKSNHKNHAGYISWSPVTVFESVYTLLDYETLKYINAKDNDLLRKLRTILDSGKKTYSVEEMNYIRLLDRKLNFLERARDNGYDKITVNEALASMQGT